MNLKNTSVYYCSQFLHALYFPAPIWIVFYYLKGITPVEISLIVTISYVTQMFWELPSGALADLLGRKKVLMVAFFLYSLSFFLLPFFEGFVAILIICMLQSISDSFRSGSEEALIYDTYVEVDKESEVSKVLSKGNSIYQIGLIISAMSGGYLYNINPNLPVIFSGISMLLGLFVVSFYVEPHLDTVKFSIRGYIDQIIQGSKEAFKTYRTALLSLLYICVGGIAWSSTMYFNEVLMVDLGYSNEFRGVLTGALRIVNILLIVFVLTRSSLFNFKRTILLFPIIMLVAYTPGVFLKDTFAPLFIQLAMLATTARWIILSPLVNKEYSSKYRATAISFLSLMIGFVYITLTFSSAYIIPNYGMKTMYTLLGFISLLTVLPISYLVLKSQNKQIVNQSMIQ